MFNISYLETLVVLVGCLITITVIVITVSNLNKAKSSLNTLKQKNLALKSSMKILNEELQQKTNQVSSMSLQVIAINSTLEELERNASIGSLNHHDLKKEINHVCREFKQAQSNFDPSKLCLNIIDPEMMTEMEIQYPNVTTQDLKLLSYLKMKLSNKEISNLTNVTVGAVFQAKRRLKKKVGLSPEEHLDNFLKNFELKSSNEVIAV